jgi:subtilase family serine protease
MKTRQLSIGILVLFILACAPISITIGQVAPTATTALPDLTITSSLISMVDINGNCLNGYEVTAYVLNQGSAVANDVVVQEFNTEHRIIIGTLAPQQGMYIQIPAGSPTGKYLLTADPDDDVTESDETNNQSSPPALAATPPTYCLGGLVRTPTTTPYDMNKYTPIP